jgi:hypothetical protein
MNQNHFTVRFQMKSSADLRVFLKILPNRLPQLLHAADRIGHLYDINFNVLNDKTLLFTGYFEGDFDKQMDKLAKSAGTALDAVFRHVCNPPPMPVSGNAADFVSWINRNSIPIPYSVTKNLN